MNKNRTYILRDHKHITETIVLFTGYPNWPLSKEAHEVLDGLERISDLHFVFTKSSESGVDPRKFSELYQSTGFSLAEDNSGIPGVLRAIEYDREFWPGTHISWNLVRGELLENVKVDEVRKIIESSDILRKSIFSIKRLSSEELYEYYKVPDTGFRALLSPDYMIGTYTTHTIPSSISWVVLKPEFLDEIMKYVEGNPEYQGTFVGIWDFLGSIAVRLGEQEFILNQGPEDVKVSTNR